MFKYGYDKKVVVKRYSNGGLGKYNRPIKDTNIISEYECKVAQHSSSTSQLLPQKKNSTAFTLYTSPQANIVEGDILYIYELDEKRNIIPETETKAIADKPYKKRTQLIVGLKSDKEE